MENILTKGDSHQGKDNVDGQITVKNKDNMYKEHMRRPSKKKEPIQNSHAYIAKRCAEVDSPSIEEAL